MGALLREVIGNVLRRVRTSQGRTLREVSDSARVSLGYLSEVERGRKEAPWLRQVDDACRDAGLLLLCMRDQNRLVYQRDEDFVASLPSELRGPMQRWYDRVSFR